MAKVRKFDTGVSANPATTKNSVPDISRSAADAVAASAPVQLRKPGNPRPRRYRQKTYSMTDEDIARVETLLNALRREGVFNRSRSDIIRAGLLLLDEKFGPDLVSAVERVENLKPDRG